MLLLITGSEDGTSDLLVNQIGNENVFRFNYDLFKDYQLEFRPNYWEIKNPAGHSIDSNSVTSAFWWKAFNFYLVDEDKFVIEEVKYIFREIYHWCRLRGIAKGNPHDFHNHMGKINILSTASKYFKIPDTLVTLQLAGMSQLNNKSIVAKSLTSGLITTNKALFTTKVNTDLLSPNYPWYLQELIDSDADVTIFICGDRLFSYSRNRGDLKGLDWRSEQNFDTTKKEWLEFPLEATDIFAIKNFCNEINVDWGRMDFMTSTNGLVFLEFNANGQWVFLDYSNEVGLIAAVIDYLCAPKKALHA